MDRVLSLRFVTVWIRSSDCWTCPWNWQLHKSKTGTLSTVCICSCDFILKCRKWALWLGQKNYWNYVIVIITPKTCHLSAISAKGMSTTSTNRSRSKESVKKAKGNISIFFCLSFCTWSKENNVGFNQNLLFFYAFDRVAVKLGIAQHSWDSTGGKNCCGKQRPYVLGRQLFYEEF